MGQKMLKERTERLFGKIAIREGIVTETQLREALEIQRFMDDPVPIGAVLVKTGAIKEEDILKVVNFQRNIVTGNMSMVKSLREDNLFGKVAVSLGYVSEDEIEECVNLQMSTFKSSFMRLGDIMTRRGYLTPHQVAHILQHQRGMEIFCPTCDTRYNVIMFIPGSTLICYRCETGIKVPRSVYKPGYADLME